MTKEQGKHGIFQTIEFIKDRMRDIYGSTLEPLQLDGSTQIVCRENITNTFTETGNCVHAHTYLFYGSHGEIPSPKRNYHYYKFSDIMD